MQPSWYHGDGLSSPSLVWGHAVRKTYLLPFSLVLGSCVSALADLGDCLSAFFVWDPLRQSMWTARELQILHLKSCRITGRGSGFKLYLLQ